MRWLSTVSTASRRPKRCPVRSIDRGILQPHDQARPRRSSDEAKIFSVPQSQRHIQASPPRMRCPSAMLVTVRCSKRMSVRSIERDMRMNLAPFRGRSYPSWVWTEPVNPNRFPTERGKP
jgi:hypothetical protein